MLGLASIAVLAGGVLRGYAGFGASMFWVASLSLIYAPAEVVPTVLALEVVASLMLLPGAAPHVEWRSMSWMLSSTLLTMPAGVLLLTVVPERPMRVVVALVILLATLATARGVDLAGGGGRRAELVAGAVSGVVNGSTGIGGPPAVLFYFSASRAVTGGRATLVAYFLAMDGAGLALMAVAGLVDWSVLVHAAVFTPLAIVGVAVGKRLFTRHGERGFRKMIVLILLTLSVAILLRA